jgi:hypothetical protein
MGLLPYFTEDSFSKSLFESDDHSAWFALMVRPDPAGFLKKARRGAPSIRGAGRAVLQGKMNSNATLPA